MNKFKYFDTNAVKQESYIFSVFAKVLYPKREKNIKPEIIENILTDMLITLNKMLVNKNTRTFYKFKDDFYKQANNALATLIENEILTEEEIAQLNIVKLENKKKTNFKHKEYVNICLNDVCFKARYNHMKKQFEYKLTNDLLFIMHCLPEDKNSYENSEQGKIFFGIYYNDVQIYYEFIDNANLFEFDEYNLRIREIHFDNIAFKDYTDLIFQIELIFPEYEIDIAGCGLLYSKYKLTKRQKEITIEKAFNNPLYKITVTVNDSRSHTFYNKNKDEVLEMANNFLSRGFKVEIEKE